MRNFKEMRADSIESIFFFIFPHSVTNSVTNLNLSLLMIKK